MMHFLRQWFLSIGLVIASHFCSQVGGNQNESAASLFPTVS